MPYETFSFVLSLFLLHLFFTLVIEGIYLQCFICTGLRAYKLTHASEESKNKSEKNTGSLDFRIYMAIDARVNIVEGGRVV